jgi:hypothetical protein
MTLRKFAAHAAMAALAAAFMFASAGVSEAAKKKAAPKAKEPSKADWCNFEYKPVCGVVGGKKVTFSNACWAKREGAKKIKPGACK